MLFLYPQMFLWLFIPALILFYFMVTARSKVMRVFSDEVYEKLSLAEVAAMGRTTRIVLIFIALLLMIVAFARPVIDKGERDVVAKGSELVIGLDISRSMDASDIYPSRMQAAIHKIKSLLETMGGDKVAIVAFAKDSYIISPMTRDKRVAAYLLDTLDMTRFEDRSSNMEAAIEATQMLSSVEKKTLLILSDGDEGDLESIKDAAKKAGVTVYAIGMAETKGSPINDGKGGYLNDPDGNIIISSLNPALRDLALQSGGAYTDFTLSSDDILSLYKQIVSDKTNRVFEQEKIRDVTELFYYPLGLALLFLLIAFHSLPGRRVAAAVLLMVSLDSRSEAASFDFDAMNQAEKYYRSGEYQKALGAYGRISGLDRDSDAARLYDMGNSYFKMEQYDKAVEQYKKSLELDKNPDTRHNLEVAQKKLQQQQEEQKQQQNKEQNKQNDAKQKQNKDQQKQQQNQEQKGDKKEEENSRQQNGKKQEEKASEHDSKQQQKGGQNSLEKAEKIDSAEERRWMKELDQKPNPVPLKKLPVTKGGKSAKYW